jgi:hypothetical protein
MYARQVVPEGKPPRDQYRVAMIRPSKGARSPPSRITWRSIAMIDEWL